MADEQVQVELMTLLTAKVDQLYSALSDASSKIEDYGHKTVDINKVAGESYTLVAAGVDYLVAHLDEFINDMVQSAAIVETQNAVLGVMAAKQGVTAEAVRETADQLSNLGYSTQTANTFLLKLTQAHVGYDQALQLSKVAQDLAANSGRDMNQVLETMGQAVLSGNARILRMYGVTTSVAAIFTSYAETLGKTSEQLTDVERRQAVVNAILAAGSSVAGDNAAAMGTAGKQSEVLKNQLDNLKEELGTGLLPMFNALLHSGLELVAWFKSLPSFVKEGVGGLVAFAAAMASVWAIALSILTLLPKLTAMWAAFNTAVLMTPFTAVFAAIAAALVLTSLALSQWDKNLEASNTKAIELLRNIREGAAATTDQIKELSEKDGAGALAMLKAREKMLQSIIDGEVQVTDYARERAAAQLIELRNIEAIVVAHQKDQALLESSKSHAMELAKVWEQGNEFLQKATDKAMFALDKEYAAAVTEAQKEIKNKEALEKALTDLKAAYEQKREEIQAKELQDYNKKSAEWLKQQKANLGLDEKEYVTYLENRRKSYVLSQKEMQAEDAEIQTAITQVHAEQLKSQKKDLESFAKSFADELSSEVDLFHAKTIDMCAIFEDMINKMVDELLAAGILDLLAEIGLGEGGNLGNTFLGGALAFDSPANDSLARQAGSNKWFNDLARNASNGYVASATSTVANGLSGGSTTGSTQSEITVNMKPVFDFASPSDRRQSTRVLQQTLRRQGFSKV